MIDFNRQAEIMRLCTQRVKAKTPNPLTRGKTSTGNLMENGVKPFEYQGNGVWIMEIDEDVAPYMKYTEEDWSMFAPPLQGKTNPNEHWFERVVGEVAEIINTELGGQLQKE